MARPFLAVGLVLAAGGGAYVVARPAPMVVEPEAEAPPAEPPPAETVAAANLASAGRVLDERRARDAERVAATWAEVLRLQREGKLAEALALASRLRADRPGVFEDKAKADVLERLRLAAEAARKKAELDKLLAAVKVPAAQKDLASARLAATAEVLARAGNDGDLDQLSRHLRRFLLPGAPGTGDGAATADVLLRSFIQDRKARRGNDKLPPVADLSEAEKRRVDQLDKLRQRDAVGLLDAIHAGLAWLALHQRDDGSLSDAAVAARCAGLRHDPACLAAAKAESTGDTYATAATALAVLAFLDFRDQDPNGWFDPYLGRGIEWLRKAQKPDGSFPGGGQQYAGAMALMAISQAAASTGLPELREAARKGLGFFEATMGPLGGYRYRPNDPQGDLSVTAWVAQAAEAAKGAGLETPFRMADGFDIFLRYVWTGEHRFAYVHPGGPSRSLAPAGMLVGHIVGKDRDPAVAASWKKYLDTIPASPAPNLYTLYYGVRLSILLNQALAEPWRSWAFALSQAQLGTGSAAGAFPVPVHQAGRMSGLATQTALAVLTLEHALYLR